MLLIDMSYKISIQKRIVPVQNHLVSVPEWIGLVPNTIVLVQKYIDPVQEWGILVPNSIVLVPKRVISVQGF